MTRIVVIDGYTLNPGFGGFMLRRAGRRQLDEALAGMARAVEP